MHREKKRKIRKSRSAGGEEVEKVHVGRVGTRNFIHAAKDVWKRVAMRAIMFGFHIAKYCDP